MREPASRKRFLRMLGGAGAASALSFLLASCGEDDEDPAAKRAEESEKSAAADLRIVNYALTLEYLEAAFYEQVVAGDIIKDKDTLDLVKRFAETEREHVLVLQATAETLGGRPARKPRMQFGDVVRRGPQTVLMVAATVENLGAAAYLGQVGKIRSREVLAAALAIHTVEARHAAALNQLVGRGYTGGGDLQGAIPDGAFAKPMSKDEVLEQVKPLTAG